MSGAVSAVGKVFKKATKSVVGKIAIGAAVSYFTAGLGASVLGATGLAGSLSPTMATVLSHGLSGAVAGGITSALTGGNFGKGLAFGALGGAVTGGVQVALGNFTPIPGATPTPNPSQAASQIATGGTDVASQTGSAMQQAGPWQNPDLTAPAWQNPDLPVGDVSGATLGNTGVVPPAGTAPPIQEMGNIGLPPGSGRAAGAPVGAGQQGAGAGKKATSNTGLLSKAGAWMEKNPTATLVAGSALTQGLGSGLLAKAQADAASERTEAEIAADRERVARTSASHSGVTGLLTPETNVLNQTPRPTPSQRFDPATYGGTWVYDQNQGRVVWVRNQAA